jgi:hypothetical protein
MKTVKIIGLIAGAMLFAPQVMAQSKIKATVPPAKKVVITKSELQRPEAKHVKTMPIQQRTLQKAKRQTIDPKLEVK